MWLSEYCWNERELDLLLFEFVDTNFVDTAVRYLFVLP
jgi:hypothetical protein